MPEIRRHIAVMFTDIVGYTRLMGSDEEKVVDMFYKKCSVHHSSMEKFRRIFFSELLQ